MKYAWRGAGILFLGTHGDAMRTSVVLALAVTLGACGGNKQSSSGGDAEPSNEERVRAAIATANSSAACVAIQPFYWEIGNFNWALAGGTASTTGATEPAANTLMLIASASKWIFGAYVAELRAGNLTANDVAALTMRSGYTGLRYASCIKLLKANQDSETVHECFVADNLTGKNDDFDASAVGKFHYNGGHFQWLADGDLGLGATHNASLQATLSTKLGSDWKFSYDSPQLAAGVQANANGYAAFLRKILKGELRMRELLGQNAVCTNPATCPDANYAPIPGTESWHYSLGHWVEDDPVVGDGAFSSPGAFGFYPWIDADKAYYGVLARHESVSITDKDPVAVESVSCGRTIRKAWATGTAL